MSMPAIKLIAVDLDGTLLTSGKVLTQRYDRFGDRCRC